jgi:hypothetical protein
MPNLNGKGTDASQARHRGLTGAYSEARATAALQQFLTCNDSLRSNGPPAAVIAEAGLTYYAPATAADLGRAVLLRRRKSLGSAFASATVCLPLACGHETAAATLGATRKRRTRRLRG